MTPKSNQFIGSLRYIHDPSLEGIHLLVLEITRSRERDVRTTRTHNASGYFVAEASIYAYYYVKNCTCGKRATVKRGDKANKVLNARGSRPNLTSADPVLMRCFLAVSSLR